MLYNLHFFSSKCRLFHNATLFGFCITHILNTGVLKFEEKKIRRQKVKEDRRYWNLKELPPDRTLWTAALADGVDQSQGGVHDPGRGGHDTNFGISRQLKTRFLTHKVAKSLASTYMHYKLRADCLRKKKKLSFLTTTVSNPTMDSYFPISEHNNPCSSCHTADTLVKNVDKIRTLAALPAHHSAFLQWRSFGKRVVRPPSVAERKGHKTEPTKYQFYRRSKKTAPFNI